MSFEKYTKIYHGNGYNSEIRERIKDRIENKLIGIQGAFDYLKNFGKGIGPQKCRDFKDALWNTDPGMALIFNLVGYITSQPTITGGKIKLPKNSKELKAEHSQVTKENLDFKNALTLYALVFNLNQNPKEFKKIKLELEKPIQEMSQIQKLTIELEKDCRIHHKLSEHLQEEVKLTIKEILIKKPEKNELHQQ
jgi:hypothetical protein